MTPDADPAHAGDARVRDTERSGGWAQRVRRLVAGTAIVVAVVVGVSMIAIAMVVGPCDALGGTCPAEPPPLWEDDMVGTAASGAMLAVAVPVFLSRPSKQRFVIALGVGLFAALFFGLIARSSG